ncbi:MAG: iron-containing alcohol dehydrogenase [Clostridia bacterium]|nr:iron-containing alcohol dehydrogenase [Clostridia bacterium]MBR4062234.1 iron-containing alcohol dehydrogenase [Clostridia bacterium]
MSFNFDPAKVCACGKTHTTAVEHVTIEEGAINAIPGYAKAYGAKKAFIIGDINTYPLAGDKITAMLEAEGICCTSYIFKERRLEPDEKAVGSLVLHYDAKSDIIISIGSGVINDISKIIAYQTNTPYVIVASAAFMDGYAAGSSSMAIDGVKVTVPAKSPDVIIGDINILNGAPIHMAKAGLGDMLAKYVSICEWRLSNLINGEYYCEEVAEFTRQSLRACVNGAKGLLDRNSESMKMLFEGLINCGKAMDYAGCSRPGGGVEHYFSHIWDMRGLDFGTPTSSHGMQVALGTLNTIKCYQELKNITPNREKALAYAKNFDFADWSEQLRTFVGKGAEAMIALEAKEKKYDLDKHAARLEVILEKWDDILRIIDEELPSVEEFEAILDSIEAPKTLEAIGLDSSTLAMTLKSTKDIRDKYVLPRLLWDIGELDEVCNKVFG